MAEPRCDAHGPYTGTEAALMCSGQWQPIPTGYLCADCQHAITLNAQVLADHIDEMCVRKVMAELATLLD